MIITTKQAAKLLSITENAFRLRVSRWFPSLNDNFTLRKIIISKKKTFYYKEDILKIQSRLNKLKEEHKRIEK